MDRVEVKCRLTLYADAVPCRDVRWPRTSGKNFDFLNDFVHHCSEFRQLPKYSARGAYPAVIAHTALQLVLGNYMLCVSDQHLGGTLESSQKVVYAHPMVKPLFTKSKKNVNWDVAVHILNFFRYHATTEHEATLYQVFQNLGGEEMPAPWKNPLNAVNDEDDALSEDLTGDYQSASGKSSPFSRQFSSRRDPGCISSRSLSRLRESRGIPSTPITDTMNDQELFLDFSPIDPQPVSDNITNRILRSLLQGPTLLDSHHRNDNFAQDHIFTGHDIADEPSTIAGILSPLPLLTRATNIPGWKRITFLYRPDLVPGEVSLRRELFETEIDDDFWCYEGLVVPGGGLMVGRWMQSLVTDDGFHAGEDSGPWICWRDRRAQ